MAFVYILKNEKDNFYIRSTTDLKRRLSEHLKGKTFTTKRMRAFDLVFSQEYKSIKEARQIEYKLKKLKRRDYIANIVKDRFIKMKL
ncbi:MAG: GIY-YIG nuclease family protein [bacterium]